MLFSLFSLISAATVEHVGSIRNDVVRIDFNNTGDFRITDLETNYVYGNGCILRSYNPIFNATVIKNTNDYIQIKGYSNDAFLIYSITSKGSHFAFKIISHSRFNTTIYFPYIGTTLVNATNSYMSCVQMNDDYSISLHNFDMDNNIGIATTEVYYYWKPENYKFDTSMTLYLTVGQTPKFRKLLQRMVTTEHFITSPHGGPFALDSSRASESYVFAVVSESNIDDWINMCLEYGIGMIHFNPAYQDLGHYEPHHGLFPSGIKGWQTCLDKIHKAGLLAGVHTLSGAVGTEDAYVHPVPDPRLAADFRYTLAEPLANESTTIHTVEKPESNFDTFWSYGGTGNVLRIGQELISYEGLSLSPPYGFTKCKRGAFKTKSFDHPVSEKLDHLFVRYGTFQPELESTLVDDVAKHIADMYDLGFDYIYHDGAEGMPNYSLGIKTIRRAIFKAVKNPGSVEASAWDRTSWTFHSRIGARDVPSFGIKRFVDQHIKDNLDSRANLLPTQMGWWALLAGNQYRYPQLMDEFEYMCCKTIVNDMAVSFQSLNPNYRVNPKQDDMMHAFKNWEILRRRKILTEEEKRMLKVPREEFIINGDASRNIWSIRTAKYPSVLMTHATNTTKTVRIDNSFNRQPFKFRLMPLFSQEPYNSPKGKVVAGFASNSEFKENPEDKSPNMTVTFSVDSSVVKDSETSLKITVKNNMTTKEGSWVRLTKNYPSLLNIANTGLGFWVYGDGKGEVLNFQFNAHPSYAGCYDDHYVIVDFKGWRYIELPLLERDADKYDDYKWPYGDIMGTYISGQSLEHLQLLDLYVNNVPAKGNCTVYITPVKALPIVKSTLKGAKISVGGQMINFKNISIESGEYFEYINNSDCRYFTNRHPDQMGNVSIDQTEGNIYMNSGTNDIEVEYDIDMANTTAKPRVKLTLFEYGDIVAGRGVTFDGSVDSSLFPGSVAGITVGVFTLIAFIAIGVLIYYKKRGEKETESEVFTTLA